MVHLVYVFSIYLYCQALTNIIKHLPGGSVWTFATEQVSNLAENSVTIFMSWLWKSDIHGTVQTENLSNIS